MRVSNHWVVVAASGIWIHSQESSAESHAAQWQTECPVTVGVPHESQEWKDVFYFGGEVLTVQLFVDGWWQGSGKDENYRGKLWWLSEKYDGLTDQTPPLTVNGRRVDRESTQSATATVTNAMSEDGDWAMLSVLEFPEAGCWEIEGAYGGQTLTFVILVGEHQHSVSSDT